MGALTDAADARGELLALYDAALPEVYGYLLRRCGSIQLAEDLTSETFIAAVDAVRRGTVPSLRVAWLIAVARNKLVDYWRRLEREQRMLAALDGDIVETIDGWDAVLDAGIAHTVLASLGAHHRSALTLRYLDALPVADVARHLERTLGATEVLLVRAKRSFRIAYQARMGEQ